MVEYVKRFIRLLGYLGHQNALMFLGTHPERATKNE